MSSSLIPVQGNRPYPYAVPQDENANQLPQDVNTPDQSQDGFKRKIVSIAHEALNSTNPVLNTQSVIIQPSSNPSSFPHPVDDVAPQSKAFLDLLETLSRHSVEDERGNKDFEMWYPFINRIIRMDELLDLERDTISRNVRNCPYSPNPYMVLNIIQQCRALTNYINQVQDESELLEFKTYVNANPDAFDLESMMYKIDTRLLEMGLQKWLEDPSATGEKEEAAELIREGFHHNHKCVGLRNLSLNQLPDCLNLLTELCDLDLSDNELTELPQFLSQLPQLIHLDLSNNLFENLDSTVENLAHLEALSLYNNRLTQLPEEIGNLKNLKYLSLSYNRLDRLPESMGNLHRLIHLGLGANRFKTFPASLGCLVKLICLYLHDNLLETFPEWIQQLNGLLILSLDNNPDLQDPPRSLFDRLRNLRYLRFSRTRLSPEIQKPSIWKEHDTNRNRNKVAKFPDLVRTLENDPNNPLNGEGQIAADFSGYDFRHDFHIIEGPSINTFSDDEKILLWNFIEIMGTHRRCRMRQSMYIKLYLAIKSPTYKQTLFTQAIIPFLKAYNNFISERASEENSEYPFDTWRLVGPGIDEENVDLFEEHCASWPDFLP